MHRPVPKTYPGIKIQNIKVDTSGFDYNAFMKLFLHEAKPVGEIHDIIEVENIVEFTVKKMGMIIIREKEHKVMDMCNVSMLQETGTSYFMNNRKVFLKKVKEMVADYKPNDDITCDSLQEAFSLLPHQKLVKSYLSPDSPYRGLLLYHGLGSGKTCSSIAIAEGLKPYKNVVVMTPKSLEMNYLQQLKKCGDPLYSLHQTWSWIQNPSEEQLRERCLTRNDLLRRNSTRGIWVNGGEEFDTLSSDDQELIKTQIDVMIHKKYKFIIYNGINEKNIKKHTGQGNPFSNNVVIVDEAHNFVSRILNVLKKESADSMHPSAQLYRLLMEAENCRVVMLTGTPMINYPNEIAVLFNMIRGYMTVWSCKGSITEEEIKEKFPDADVILRKIDTIMVTQSPQGFVRGNSSDVKNTNYDSSKFDENITEFFKLKGCTHIKKEKFKALPDTEEEFYSTFIKANALQNKTMLMSRIAGLSSYFPDLLQLMPVLRPTIEHRVPMSVTQFDEYKIARLDEKKNEKKSDKGSGSYRILSRLLCNTTYPVSARKKRPMNYEDEVVGDDEEEKDVRGVAEFFKEIDESDYTKRIEEYSPKYKAIIDVIQSKKGLQLLYSQFLNIEGIKLFSRVLESKGYTEFKLSVKDGVWDLDTVEVDKPMYIIYGGTKTSADKKELFRNIFNKNWEAVPELLREKVKNVNIPLFMITSAGAEGISLRHVQYVHLMEPYWNPVRIDQVIGRARRICSHNTLPEKDRFVEVHLYLSMLPDKIDIPEGLKTDVLRDGNVGSTDEYLYLLAQQKRTLSADIMDCIRRSSIDCSLYGSGCLSLPYEDEESMLFLPDIKMDVTKDTDVQINIKKSESTYISTTNGERVLEFKSNEIVDGYMPLYPYGKSNQIGFVKDKKLYDMNKKAIKLSDALKLI